MDYPALIQAYLDDELNEQQLVELSDWLAQSEANRESFVQASILDTQIHRQLLHADLHRFLDQVDIHGIQDALAQSPDDEADALAAEIDAKPGSTAQSEPELTMSRAMGILTRAGLEISSEKLRQHAAPLALAAALALALTLFFIFQGGPATPGQPNLAKTPEQTVTPKQRPIVATITATHNATWMYHETEDASASGSALLPGSPLFANHRLTLLEGFAQITTTQGAVVILEAPCAVELTDDNNAIRLHAGKLVGICETPVSRGFTVYTPDSKIIDTGTRFGVQVSRITGTEVRVFEGDVELYLSESGTDQPPTQLAAGESARVQAGTQQVVTTGINEAAFTQNWQALAKAPQLQGRVDYKPSLPMVLTNGHTESSNIQLFPERFSLRLETDHTVTLRKAGRTQPKDRSESTLPAGLVVDSYLVHYDQTSPPQGILLAKATIRFDRPILGVVATVDHMKASHDTFGVQSVTYATMDTDSGGARFSGLDDFLSVDAIDQLQISEDRKTLTLSISTLDGTDQIRVVVQADADATPTTDTQAKP